MKKATKPKVLHCITAYNGDVIVPRSLKSAMELDKSIADIDVLLLDDCSPQPGFSESIEKLCKEIGAYYYRTPRNLGIPRNCSLGLITALKKGYDFVTINNSDVIFSKNVINELLKAYYSNQNVGSVTAWSNNVSIYSIPNSDPDYFIGTQEGADLIASHCSNLYSGSVLDIPAGISFCILIPTSVVADVGINDPIFGRGYCEETDWSLRSLKYGYRVCLAPGAFTYHQGRGSNLGAGLVTGDQTTVPENEEIIDLRFPDFRSQCDRFISNNPLRRMHGELASEVVENGLKQKGYEIEISENLNSNKGKDIPVLHLLPGKTASYGIVNFKGFSQHYSFDEGALVESIKLKIGVKPVNIETLERCELNDILKNGFGFTSIIKKTNYPSFV